MKNFTKLFCTALLLLAGSVSASAQEGEKVYATFENPSGIAWDAKNKIFSWDSQWGNQLHNIGLPNGNISEYEKLVVDCEILEGDGYRFMFYATNQGTTAGGVTIITESGKKEYVIADLKLSDDYITKCSEICLSGYNASGKVKVNEVYLVKSSNPLAGAKKLLSDAINNAKLQTSFAKTEASWNALQKAITDAEAVLATATDAATLDAAKASVDAAVKGLTLLEGYSDLTEDMLFSWTGWDATAVQGNQAGCSYDLFISTGQPYGDGSVIAFADLSEYDKLQIVSNGGTPRFLFNRDVDEGQWNENEAESHLIDNTKGDANSWHAKYFSQDGDVYTVDLAQLVADKGYAHLHAIKTVGGNVVVSGMYLYKAPEAPKHTWDFTAWSDATISNLKAEAAKVTVEDDPENEGKTKCTMNDAFWSDHEKANKCDTYDASKNNCFWYVGGEAEPTANGETIAELKGLVFNDAYGKGRSLAIAVNYPSTSLGTYEGPSYLWLGGKDKDCFTIKSVKVGSELVIAAESHKPAEARGIQLKINGENFGNPFTPTTFAENTWTITSSDENAKVVDVVVHNTNGCHLYYIDAVIDNTVTGIQTVTTTKENGAYYDLQGRRVAQPAKGLYILNGKKVIIK